VRLVVFACVVACGSEDVGSNYRDVQVFREFFTVDPQQVSAGDIDGDGDQDFVFVDEGEVYGFINDGKGRFSATDIGGQFAGFGDRGLDGTSVALADITGGGSDDIIVSNINGGLAMLVPDGSGSYLGGLLPTKNGAGSVPPFPPTWYADTKVHAASSSRRLRPSARKSPSMSPSATCSTAPKAGLPRAIRVSPPTRAKAAN